MILIKYNPTSIRPGDVIATNADARKEFDRICKEHPYAVQGNRIEFSVSINNSKITRSIGYLLKGD